VSGSLFNSNRRAQLKGRDKDNQASAGPRVKTAAWTGLEALEQRTLLSGSVAVMGGSNQTAVIASNDHTPSRSDYTDFAYVVADGSGMIRRTFTIGNSGDSTLNLTGAKVSLGGADAADFLVTSLPADSVAAGGTTSFEVACVASLAGDCHATLTIASDDPATPSYAFDIQASAVYVNTTSSALQYLTLTPGGGTTVEAGDNMFVNYTGYLTTGLVFDTSLAPDRLPYGIDDIGNASANGLIAGWNEGLIGMQVGETRLLVIPSDLGYGAAGSQDGRIPPNATIIFEVTAISVNSNIQVRGGAGYPYVIYDTQRPTSLLDHTDFGDVYLTGATSDWTFGILNFGGSDVHLAGTPHVVIGGANAADFTVTRQPADAIQAYDQYPGLTEFSIQFNPGALGLRTATVSLMTDDPDELGITFNIQGFGFPNILSGAREDTPFAISFSSLYQAMYGTVAPANATPFVISGLLSGTLTKTNAPVQIGTTLISPGQSVAWKPAVNANHTQNAFTVRQWDGSQAVGDALPVLVEVAPAEDAPVGAPTDIVLRPSADARSQTINLSTIFDDPDVDGSVVRFVTSKGAFYVNTFSNTPTNTANFLSYVSGGKYNNSLIHSVTPNSVVRGGAYGLINDQLGYIDPDNSVDYEYGYANVRGAIAVDRSVYDYNGDTGRFVFNLADNSRARDGSYTVFGEVKGNGMSVITGIASLPRQDLSANPPNGYGNPDFASLPVQQGDFVMVNSVTVVPPLVYKVTSGNKSLVTTSLGGANLDSLTLNIAAGATGSATIQVTATDVTGKSVTKSFNVIMPVVTVRASDASAGETAPGKGANPGAFEIKRTGATTSPLTVQYQIGGTAIDTNDYAHLSGTVTIPAGKSSVLVNVAPVDDAIVEAVETVTMTLVDDASLLYRVGTASQAAVNILDNDLPTLSISAVSDASETAPAANLGTFQIMRSDVTSDPLTVYFSRSGTAGGADCSMCLSGSLTPITCGYVVIPGGQASVSIDVRAVDDALAEANESVILTLQARNTYIRGATPSATVWIADNEPVVSVAASGSPTEPNTPGVFTISRTGPTAAPLTVSFSRGGTASAGADYVNFATTVTIPVGASSVDVSVQPLADDKAEPLETVIVALTAKNTYNLAPLAANRTAGLSIVDGARSATVDPVLMGLSYSARTYSLASLAGKTLAVSAQVRNQGLAASNGAVDVALFLSKDRQLGGADEVSLGLATLASLAAGQTLSFNKTVTMNTLAGLAAGLYYVVAEASVGGNVFCSALCDIVITA
jgi:cyclophilin family peptidyl-prolyl cis-trans isomerase/FKBP-type peptidyl-prolyl cis-trans isomerase 2